jgi:hypothetical protein
MVSAMTAAGEPGLAFTFPSSRVISAKASLAVSRLTCVYPAATPGGPGGEDAARVGSGHPPTPRQGSAVGHQHVADQALTNNGASRISRTFATVCRLTARRWSRSLLRVFGLATRKGCQPRPDSRLSSSAV